MKNLNQNEIAVLKACMNAIIDFTGCEFGVVNEIKANGISANQLKGYLSQLQSKEYISIYEFSPRDKQDNRVKLTVKGCDYLLSTTTNESEIVLINDIKDNL